MVSKEESLKKKKKLLSATFPKSSWQRSQTNRKIKNGNAYETSSLKRPVRPNHFFFLALLKRAFYICLSLCMGEVLIIVFKMPLVKYPEL